MYINQQEEKVQEQENVFRFGNTGAGGRLKIKVIQEMIQLECPFNLSIDKAKKITNKINLIEI